MAMSGIFNYSDHYNYGLQPTLGHLMPGRQLIYTFTQASHIYTRLCIAITKQENEAEVKSFKRSVVRSWIVEFMSILEHCVSSLCTVIIHIVW